MVGVKRILWLIAIPAALAQSPNLAPDPRELLKESAQAIRQFPSYQLESVISIEMHGGPMNEKLTMPSSIAVRKPGKLRIESTSEAGSITIVGDGEHTWFYLSTVKKFVKRDAIESPEAAIINAGVLPKNLPDLNQSIKSIKITGEEAIMIAGAKIPCWVIDTVYDKITLPEQEVLIHDAAQTTWVSKDHRLTLQSTFSAKINLPGVAEPVEMMQSTRTTKMILDAKLPDSLFVFTPPAGTKETDDWTLPGVSKPDVIGKPAPAELVNADTKGKVVLAYFTTSPCAPCDRDRTVIEKLKGEFQDLVVITPAREFPELAVTSWPTVVVIDRDGKIASYEAGARGEAALRVDLKKAGLETKPSPF
jgi:outer membrane lipoprotein-sorting protein